jgi:hypothetical protein
MIPADVSVVLFDGSNGTIGDVTHDNWVDITATSQTGTTSPIARVIKIVSSPDGPENSGNSNSNGKNDDDTLTGIIVLVDAGKSSNQRVVVVSNPDGSDGAAGINPDTVVSGDTELEPGQEVEITLGDDGFSATNIEVTPPIEPTATPVPPIEYILSGKIRSVSGQGVILDDVFLALDTNSPTTDPLVVGQDIQFKVIIDADGRWVVVGIEP